MAAQNLAKQILEKDDLPLEPVEVPEWGITLYVKTMTGAERDRWELQQAESRRRNRINLRASLVAITACDSNGDLVFSPDDVEALGRKSAAALDRIAEVAMRLNHLLPDDLEKLEKNS